MLPFAKVQCDWEQVMKESRDEERLGGARSSAAKGSESSSSSLSSSSAPSSSSLLFEFLDLEKYKMDLPWFFG